MDETPYVKVSECLAEILNRFCTLGTVQEWTTTALRGMYRGRANEGNWVYVRLSGVETVMSNEVVEDALIDVDAFVRKLSEHNFPCLAYQKSEKYVHITQAQLDALQASREHCWRNHPQPLR